MQPSIFMNFIAFILILVMILKLKYLRMHHKDLFFPPFRNLDLIVSPNGFP